MYRDPSEFRERFKAYKDGKSVREIYGLPGYHNGKFDDATKKKIDYYYKLLRNNGFDMMSAIGILGNMMQESSFNPNIVNHLGYHGLLQNSKAIQKAIKDLYGDLSELSLLRYLSDWTDGATWIRKGPYASDTALYSKSYLRSGYKTPEQAAYEFLKRYERAIVVDPKTKKALRDTNGNYIYLDKDKRLGYAKSIYNYLSGLQDDIQELITQVGKTQPEPIIDVPDATRVSTIPTIQLQAIDYADRRNTFIAEAERQLEVKRNMANISDMIFGQQPIYKSDWGHDILEYGIAEHKYAGGKLPGYLKGLTPQQIEETIVKNQGTIQQGHRLSPLSTVANSMYRDYRKPFAQLFTEGGLGNFARGLQRLFDSLNKEARGIADVADHANVLLDILTLAGGSVAKLSAKQAIREVKLAAKKTIKPTKTSIKKTLNATEVAEDVASKPKVKIDPKKYEQQTEYTRKITNQKTLKYNKTKLPSETPVLNSTDFPENTNINALYGPEGMLFSNKIVNNDRLMDIAVPHEFKHYLQLYYNYTPELAMIMERAFPFSEKFIKEHPDFNFVKEGGAMLSELEYEIGKRYGFPVGKDFEDVVKHISKQEYEDMASKLSLYNRDANAERIRTGIDKSALVDALIKVPATTAPILAIDRNRQYNNGKLPGYKLGTNPTNATMYDDGTFVDDYTKVFDNLVATGTDRRPLYQRYDAPNSTYDPDVIRNFTDFAPIVGDIGLGLDAYNAFKNLDYLQAGVLGGLLLLPNAIEKSGKQLLRFGLRNFPEFTKTAYDISKLYGIGIKDNLKLRTYANEVSDLLSSDKIKNRALKYGDYNFMLVNNIANTPMMFLHGNNTFARPVFEVFGRNIKSPIPIPIKYAGLYDKGNGIFIKRSGRTADEIRNTAYHETSHASDLSIYVPDYYNVLEPNKTLDSFHLKYLGDNSEKRARAISTLTDAYHHGIDIDDPIQMSGFLNSLYDGQGYIDLLLNYNNKKGESVRNMLLGAYKNGKIAIKPANRGKFNATKKRTGKTTEELTHSKNPLTRKRAIFAQNARKWHHADGKLPDYEDGRPRITTGGAGVTSVYLPATNSPEVQPTVDLLERIANFLPYVGTIQDWEQVVNGNIGKVPSAVIGTVADIFLPGLRSSYKVAKAYEAASKAAPKLVDKIKYYKASQKAYKKTAANVGYLVAGTYEDILDDLGYQFPLFINK